MPVSIELHEGPRGPRIWLRSPWAPDAAAKAKRVPGHSWRKTESVWTYPLSLQTCRDLRDVYGDDLEIGPRLTTWARKERLRERRLHRLGRRHDAQLQHVDSIAPGLAAAMSSRKYQRSGARFIAESRSVLIADEPSLGKTATALAGIMEADLWRGVHLVVAPKTSLDSTWDRQIGLWGGATAEAFPMPDGRAAREKTLAAFHASTADARFLLVGPHMLQTKLQEYCKKCQAFKSEIQPDKNAMPKEEFRDHFAENHRWVKTIFKQDWPELFEIEWNSVILDESHEVLSAYTPSNKTQVVEGLKRLSLVDEGLRIALTGTPLRGREVRLWGTLDWLGATAGGYWDWVKSYFETNEHAFGFEIVGLEEKRRPAFYAAIDTTVLRRLKSEVRPEIGANPPAVDHWVSMTPKQARMYDAFALEGEVLLNGGILSSSGVLSEFTRRKQLAFGEWAIGQPFTTADGRELTRLVSDTRCRSPKFEALMDLLRERGVTGDSRTEWRNESGGHKYVIASQFSQVIDYLEGKLNSSGIQTLKITGAVTGKKRAAAVRSFDTDPDGPRVILVNTKTGGTSIDLDTYCDEMFFMDETFIDDDQVQMFGRINNRKGEVRPRWRHYIRTRGTVDADIARDNATQAYIASAMLDIRRGVDVDIRQIAPEED